MASSSTYSTGRPLRLTARWLHAAGALAVTAFLVSVVVRPVDSNITWLDGWAVDLFEVGFGLVCMLRWFDPSWRSTRPGCRLVPVVLGLACILWGLGDVALTVLSAGGVEPPVPSVVDAFYIGFFPLCYLSLVLLLRGQTRVRGLTSWLDRVVAALAVAAVFTAFLMHPVLRTVGGLTLSSATTMAYPLGDLLLLAVVAGALAAAGRERRGVLVRYGVALAVLTVGDTFSLLQADSRVGHTADAVAWPIAILVLSRVGWLLDAEPAERQAPVRSGGFVRPSLGAGAALIVLVGNSAAGVGSDAAALATGTLAVVGVRLALAVRRAQAVNDERQRILSERQDSMLTVLTEVARSAELLAGASERLTATATQLRVGATEASSQADAVATRSRLISTSMQTAAGGTSDLSSSIAEIARHAADGALAGAEAMRESADTNLAMTRLSGSSAEIGKVVDVITSIAEQTNLLALNATIEAARAGEAGRGFVVVAAEIKALAAETAQATTEISAMIAAIQTDSARSAEAIGRIGQRIGSINDLQNTIAAALEEQTATTRGVGGVVADVSDNADQINHHVAAAAHAAREVADGTGDTLAAASDLAAMAATLRTLVTAFGDGVAVAGR